MTVSIREVKQQHQTQWLAKPGVVSVGIGMDAQKKPVIVIGVKQLSAELSEAFPRSIEGYPILLKEAGEIQVQ